MGTREGIDSPNDPSPLLLGVDMRLILAMATLALVLLALCIRQGFQSKKKPEEPAKLLEKQERENKQPPNEKSPEKPSKPRDPVNEITNADEKKAALVLASMADIRVLKGKVIGANLSAKLRGEFFDAEVSVEIQNIDSRLECLTNLPNLEDLNLRRTNFGDAGMAHFNRLANLRILNLAGTKITDSGLSHLKNLQRLQELDLTYTKVSTRGLRNLSTLKSLNLLRIGGTDVRFDQVDVLKKLLPGVSIVE